jgi:hypothetical protein
MPSYASRPEHSFSAMRKIEPSPANPSIRRTLPVEANIHPAVNSHNSTTQPSYSGFEESLAYVRSCSTKVFAQCPFAFRCSARFHDSPVYAADAPNDRVSRQYARILDRLSRPKVDPPDSSANPLDGDRVSLILRAPPRWTPGRLSPCLPGEYFDQRGNKRRTYTRQVLPIAGCFIRRSHESEDAEISCGFGFASRLVFLYARGRDMYRVPIES